MKYLFQHSTFRKEYHDEKMDWNILAVEKLLTALINTKLMSIRRMPPSDSDSERSCYYYPEDFRDREPPDKRYAMISEFFFLWKIKPQRQNNLTIIFS